MERFQSGSVNLLLATDVGAEGVLPRVASLVYRSWLCSAADCV